MDIDSGNTPKGVDEAAEDKKGKQIVLILVGAPGSGKSTFCDLLMRSSARPWSRICQDTIGNGKAGTKAQCLMSAASALKESKSVIIDRCNIDREQRADFVKLGNPQVDVHAVVLDLPAKLCISRSVKRTGHEGNLQGGRAAAVVNRMLQNKELPKLSEGFSRITFCNTESDVQAAIHAYNELGLSDSLPPGCFGQKNPDSKVQVGIMKFLKKVDKPSTAQSDASLSKDTNSVQMTKEMDSGHEERNKVDCTDKEVNNGKDIEMGSVEGIIHSNNVLTLAFPSISTADFQFNLEKASDIIVEKVEDFLSKHGNARLVLVDLSQSSKILSLVRTKSTQKNIDSNKFLTFVGDITRLYSEGGLRCNVIANAANWRLKPKSGGVNAAIFSAAGPELEIATMERAGSIAPGKAVVVPLPPTSPLFTRERVTHVIHVLGPNMNPLRPNYLNNNYDKGCKVLREAYTSLFEGFASLMRTQENSSNSSGKLESGLSESQDHLKTCAADKFFNSDPKAKREIACKSEKNKKSKGSGYQLALDIGNNPDGRRNTNDEKIAGSMTKSWSSWAQALFNIAMQPEKHKGNVMETSDDIVVLNDLYPKAQKHLLILARTVSLDCLADVRKEHLPLLRSMHAMGLKWAENFLTENKSLVFRLGYHSMPSMRQLHLHVISQDFDSKHLKNKKHWNSFCSPFFRDSVDVMEEVARAGKATLKDEISYLSMELRCHRCKSAHPNIPRLKSHVSNCQASFPAALLQNGRLIFAASKKQH